MNLAKLTVLLKYLAGHMTFGYNSSSKAAQSILLIYTLQKLNYISFLLTQKWKRVCEDS